MMTLSCGKRLKSSSRKRIVGCASPRTQASHVLVRKRPHAIRSNRAEEARRNSRVERRNRVSEISNHRQLAGAHAIQLCGIDFKVNDLRIRRKACGIAGHAIIEARAKNHKQIGLVQSHVGRARSMHSHHAQVIRCIGRNRSQSMDGGESRNIQIVEQSAQLRNCSRKLCSRTHQRDWLGCALQQAPQLCR